jgi:hypothetical protein
VIKSRRIGWAGNEALVGERKVIYSLLEGKPEGKRPLRRPRLTWEDNIKINHK